MPIEQLGHGAAELLSLTNGGEARSLNKLTELAARQVPSCSGAHAAVWRDGEVVSGGTALRCSPFCGEGEPLTA